MRRIWVIATEQLPQIGEIVLVEGRDGVTVEGFLTAGGYWNLDGHLEPPGYAVAWKAKAEKEPVRCIMCRFFREDKFDSLGFCRLCQDLRADDDTCRLGREKDG